MPSVAVKPVSGRRVNRTIREPSACDLILPHWMSDHGVDIDAIENPVQLLGRKLDDRSLPGAAIGTCPRSTARTSQENAASTSADQQLVLVTHQFHPLFGRQLPCVGKRSNLQGERLLLHTDDGAIWPLPPQWTLVSIDPEVAASNGRALLLVSNLMELAAWWSTFVAVWQRGRERTVMISMPLM